MKLKNVNTGLIFLMDGKRAIALASSSDYEVIESSNEEKELYKKEKVKSISLEDKLLGKEESTITILNTIPKEKANKKAKKNLTN